MNKLVEAIQSTIEQLKAHPYIVIDEANIYEPATAAMIDTFEIVTNVRLPENVKDFYLSANGLSCVWRIKQDLPAEVMDKIKREGERRDYDYSTPLGAIKILPVQDMIMDKYWDVPFQDSSGTQAFEFSNREFTLGDFAKKLKIFDRYYLDNDFEGMAFITEFDKATRQYYLLMLDDHFADWQNSRLVDFDTYITAMCKTRFTIPSRRRLFGKYRGDKEPVLTFDMISQTELEPALFREL